MTPSDDPNRTDSDPNKDPNFPHSVDGILEYLWPGLHKKTQENISKAPRKPQPETIENKEVTNVNYYSRNNPILSALETAQTEAQEKIDEIETAETDLSEAREDLERYVDELQNLIDNLSDLPTVDVSVNVDFEFSGEVSI